MVCIKYGLSVQDIAFYLIPKNTNTEMLYEQIETMYSLEHSSGKKLFVIDDKQIKEDLKPFQFSLHEKKNIYNYIIFRDLD